MGGSKCTTLAGDVDAGAGAGCVGGRRRRETLWFLLKFDVNLKLLLNIVENEKKKSWRQWCWLYNTENIATESHTLKGLILYSVDSASNFF